MAGEIWRTYDVAKIGNDGFDDADLNHLINQKYANNDILKIAAASGRVDASTDQRLRNLNNETISMSKVPMKAQGGLFRRGILDNVIYLGGDPNDDKSYAAGPSGGTTRSNNSPNVGGSREIENEPQTQWINNSSTKDIPRGDRSEILRWEGINANGSAAALRGTRVEEDRDGDQQMLKTRDTTWRIPDDYLPPRQQAGSAGSGSGSGSTSTAPAEAAAPLTERFDASKYALRTPTTTSSESDASASPARSQIRFGYTNLGGGIELGGFERFVKGLPSV